jgi:hypothetical protein
MTSQSNKITDLDTLDQEILRLRRKVKGMEKALDENLSHLQSNYGSMLLNSLLGEKPRGRGILEGLVNLVVHHERLKGTLTNLGSQLAERAAAGIELWLERLFDKK